MEIALYAVEIALYAVEIALYAGFQLLTVRLAAAVNLTLKGRTMLLAFMYIMPLLVTNLVY